MPERTDRWLRIKILFDAALEWSPTERQGRLRQAAGDLDDSLVAEVEALLDANEQAAGFLDEPVLRTTLDQSLYERLLEEQNALPAGRQLGAYRILREIGRGGMGIIYLAERADQEYAQRIAIKVLTPGLLNADSSARFRTERQILAVLDHPNIAKLLDGGTTESGLPFLVMQYIEGSPIDEYCEQKQVSIRDRLRLFCTACDAVHYAHQHLIVHRDLKPANILVTSEGVPKLLDFGIAKLLDSGLGLTRTFQRPMTPEYASPEQVRGEAITTATDVYALGVLLYRLLTRQGPFQLRTRSVTELEYAICHSEPLPPSKAGSLPGPLRRQLRGDLDNIVLLALSREPQLRYRSAAEMAQDICRHLEGRPVLARKPNFRYYAAKFVRRNVLAVVLSTVLMLCLVGGIIATSWQAARARRERGLAEEHLAAIRKLANSVLIEFHDQVKSLPGALPARRYLLSKGLEYLEVAGRDTSREPAFLRELMQAYFKVGTIQGDPFNPNLGDVQAAAASYRKALGLAEELVQINPSDSRARRDLAEALRRSGDLPARCGDPREAVPFYDRSIAILQNLAGSQSARREIREELAEARYRIGDVLFIFGDLERAGEHYGRMLEIRHSIAAIDRSYVAQRDLAIAYDRLGELALDSGDTDGALAMHRSALAIREPALAASSAHTLKSMDVAKSLRKIGYCLFAMGDYRGALERFQQAAQLLEELWRADPLEVGGAFALARTMDAISHAAAALRRPGEAARASARCLSIAQEFANRPKARSSDRAEYAWYLLTAEDPRLRNPGEALLHASQAVELSRRGHPRHLYLLALAQSATAAPERALATAREALAVMAAPSTAGPASRIRLEIERLIASGGSLSRPVRRPLVDQ